MGSWTKDYDDRGEKQGHALTKVNMTTSTIDTQFAYSTNQPWTLDLVSYLEGTCRWQIDYIGPSPS